MRGFEVVTGLTSIIKFLEQFNANSLYEEELVKSYKECLRVAMSVVATEGSNELGGFYEGNPLIKTIERALEISLVSWQKDYVLHKSNAVPKTRGCGNTGLHGGIGGLFRSVWQAVYGGYCLYAGV